MTSAKQSDDVALVVYDRVLDKLSGGGEAANALARGIGLTLAGVKK